MSEKVGLADDYGAPPYEDSTTPPPAFTDSKDFPGPSLRTQLTETRTRRIQNLLTTHIESQLYSQFLDGIYKRALLIIPADTLSQHPHLAAKDVVNLPYAGEVTVIRLHGDENRAVFWQQPAVLQELASSLRARLVASGHKVESADAITGSALRSSPTPLKPGQSDQEGSQSWLRKQFGTPGPQHDPTATTNYRLGWRAEDEGLTRQRLALDEVRVVVKVREVSFRVETEMGLLDSVTGKVLWLEIEVGT